MSTETIESDQVDPPGAAAPSPHWLPRAAVVGGLFLAASVAMLAAVLLPVQPARAGRPWWLYLLCVVTLVAVPVLVRRRTRVRVTAVLAGAGALLAGWALVVDVRGGLPTRVFPLMVGAFLALLAAVLLLARARGTRQSIARTAVAGLVVAVLAGAAVLGVSQFVVRLPVHASTADDAAGEVTATVPTGVRWSYDLPDGQQVADQGVVAAGSGAAVLLEDGVVALDGATGAVRWEYRRAGARAVQIAASPDGAHVAVLFRSGSDDVDGTLLVFLDGRTGQVGAELVKQDDHGPYSLPMTGRVLVSGDERTVTGRSLGDGSISWTWQVPDGCRKQSDDAGLDAAVVLLFCPGSVGADGVARATVQVIGLDDRTGEQRWVREDELAVPSGTALPEGMTADLSFGSPGLVQSGPDGTAVRVEWSIQAPAAAGDQLTGTQLILAVDDGRVLTGDTVVDLSHYPLAFDERGTVLHESASGAYTRVPADGSAVQAISPAVGSGAEIADLGTALVQLGAADAPVGQVRVQVAVSPWDGSPPSRLTLDFGPRSSYGIDIELRPLPGVLVVVVPASTQVVAVG